MSHILDELDRLVDKDEDRDDEKDEEGDEERKDIENIDDRNEDENVGEILKHIEAVEDAAEYIDGLTPKMGAGDTIAFEAEISLRKAIERMKKLSDMMYKKQGKKEIK